MTAARDVGYRDELARLTPDLRQFARALVHDHAQETADDLVQATLVRALGVEQRRTGERLVIWLMSNLTALHRSQSAIVRADHQVTVGTGHAQNGATRRQGWEPGRSPGGSAGVALGDVPVECREVLLLATLVKLSYPQIAETLGISINTVVARLARAREQLARTRFGESAVRPTERARAASRPKAAAYLRVIK